MNRETNTVLSKTGGLDETGLTEIEFEHNGERVRVARRAKRAAAPAAGRPNPSKMRCSAAKPSPHLFWTE